MHVVFLSSDKPRERILAEAFTEGVKAHGDTAETQRLQPDVVTYPQADVVCMVGVKSRELFAVHTRMGTHVCMLDKGYTRHSVSGGVRAWEYWRVAVDAHHPTHYLMKQNRPADRLARLNLPGLSLPMQPWRKRGKHIVFAGSSQKYHDFYGLADPTTYAQKTFKRLRNFTDREIVYRPKTSWKDAVSIADTLFSHGRPIEEDLAGAHALVTHGSNACFESVLAGVPCLVTGDAVAKPISAVGCEQIENLIMVDDAARQQWLANLAYQQWTQAEMGSGEAWNHIRPEIYG